MTGVSAFGNARVVPIRAHVLVQDGAAIMYVGRAAKSIWLRICKFTSVSDQFHQNSTGVKAPGDADQSQRCCGTSSGCEDLRRPASLRQPAVGGPRSEVNHLRPFLIGQS